MRPASESGKSEFRNPKYETSSKLKIQMFKKIMPAKTLRFVRDGARKKRAIRVSPDVNPHGWRSNTTDEEQTPFPILGIAMPSAGSLCFRSRILSVQHRGLVADLSPVKDLPKPCRWLAAFAWFATAAALGAEAQQALEKTFESGPVKATVKIEPVKPLIGDPVTLTITATAEKGVELLMPEFGEALERFSIIDFVPRESIDDQGRTVAVQRYRLQPPSSGPQAVPPILIEYVDRREGQREAPEGLDAYELLTERLEFEVQSVIPKDAKTDLKPPLGRLAPLEPSPGAKWPWVVGTLAMLAVASPFAVRAIAAWRRRTRRRSAYDIARWRLDRLLAKPRPTAEQIDAFYVELSGIVRRYLEDRFELRAPELTTEEFLASVGQSPDLSRDHQALLRDFLRQADLVKFAGVQPSNEDIEHSIDAARRFIDETRENAPLVEEGDELRDTVFGMRDTGRGMRDTGRE